MTHQTFYGRRFSYENDADVADLVTLVQHDGAVGELVEAFNPGGAWCLTDEHGEQVKRDGQFVVERLTDRGIANYWHVLRAVNVEAVEAMKEARASEWSRRDTAVINATGSTGGDWLDEHE